MYLKDLFFVMTIELNVHFSLFQDPDDSDHPDGNVHRSPLDLFAAHLQEQHHQPGESPGCSGRRPHPGSQGFPEVGLIHANSDNIISLSSHCT